MERPRKSWRRGAIVLGLAGTMMAAALMSPALAVRLATTSYVKQKVNQAFNKTFSFFLQQPVAVFRSDPISLPTATGVLASIACPPGGVVTGGGASVGSAAEDWDLEASYPSNGATPAAGTTGWTVSMTNESPGTLSFRVYILCAGGTGVTNFAVGSTPVRSTDRWAPSAAYEPQVSTKLLTG